MADESPILSEPASSSSEPSSPPDYPKPLVKLRRGTSGYEADVLMAGSSEAESAAKDSGWQAIDVPPELGPQEFPKWKFHEDGRRTVVSNQEEAEKLEGFNDEPPEPKEEDVYAGAVPPAVGDAVMPPSSTRGPVPVDRG
jgi:hypothetical protein